VARTFVEAGLEAIKMPQLDARDMGANFGEFKSLAKLESSPLARAASSPWACRVHTAAC
jgi:hypothetical protein